MTQAFFVLSQNALNICFQFYGLIVLHIYDFKVMYVIMYIGTQLNM